VDARGGHLLPEAGFVACGSSLLASESPMSICPKPTPGGDWVLFIHAWAHSMPALSRHIGSFPAWWVVRHAGEGPLALAEHFHLAPRSTPMIVAS
jgi:hypothetical protein